MTAIHAFTSFDREDEITTQPTASTSCHALATSRSIPFSESSLARYRARLLNEKDQLQERRGAFPT